MGAIELLRLTELTSLQRKCVEICRRSVETLVAMSPGFYQASSEPGAASSKLAPDLAELAVNGVTFLRKPVSRVQLLDAITVATQAAIGPGVRPLHILLADDSADNRTLIAEYLRGTPHHLDTAADGRSAVRQCEARRYDLILMDLEMPVMNGHTAIRVIRAWEHDHEQVATPIILLTAHELRRRADPRH